MNFKEAIDALVDNIMSMVSSIIDKAPFDKTYTGIVKSVQGKNVTIVVNGVEHVIKTDALYYTNDYVTVLVPRNNWDRAMITPKDNVMPYMCEVYYNAGGGDASFTGDIVFNTVIQNIGNCYNTSTGRFTCPVNGIYLVIFEYYSNQSAVNGRASIRKNGTPIMQLNGPYGQHTAAVTYCTAGTYLTAGAMAPQYSISFYAAHGHNRFQVVLLRAM